MRSRMPRRTEPPAPRPPDAAPASEELPPAWEEPIPRVIQRSGASTLVVSLPKDWIEREGLRAGQFVSWLPGEGGDLRLLLPHQGSSRPGRPELRIHAPHLASGEHASRLLLSTYVLGYDRVRIEDPKGMQEEVRRSLEKTTHELLGFTLTEGSRTTVVATSFLDPAAHPVTEVVSRLGYALDFLLERVETALKEGSSQALQRVPEIRVEVRRLHALALRQLNLAAGNPRLARQLGVPRSSHLLGTRVVAKLLDDIAEATEVVAGEIARWRRVPAAALPVAAELEGRMHSLRERLHLGLAALRSGSPKEAELVLQGNRAAAERVLRTEEMIRKVPVPESLRHSLSLCSWWIGVARQHAEAVADVAFTRTIDRSASVMDLSGGAAPLGPRS